MCTNVVTKRKKSLIENSECTTKTSKHVCKCLDEQPHLTKHPAAKKSTHCTTSIPGLIEDIAQLNWSTAAFSRDVIARAALTHRIHRAGRSRVVVGGRQAGGQPESEGASSSDAAHQVRWPEHPSNVVDVVVCCGGATQQGAVGGHASPLVLSLCVCAYVGCRN